MRPPRAAATATCAGSALLLASAVTVNFEKIQKITVSPASTDFATENAAGCDAASKWCGERLRSDAAWDSKTPYGASFVPSTATVARPSNPWKNFGKSAIFRVSNSETDESCFIVMTSPFAATGMLSAPETSSILVAGPFLPSLKLASDLVDHGADVSDCSSRLRYTYGEHVTPDNVRGLSVRLSPGILPRMLVIPLPGTSSAAGAATSCKP